MTRPSSDWIDCLRAALQGRAAPLPDAGLRPAAVLVPILSGDPLRLILVRRPATLRQHAGQVAFPGGVQEPGDVDLAVTARRETAEELGVPEPAIDLLGPLEPVSTLTGYAVAPFVGVLPAGTELQPNGSEVDRILLPALPELLAQQPEQSGSRVIHEGRPLPLIAYRIQGERVWGATARILKLFLDLARSGSTIDKNACAPSSLGRSATRP